MVVIITTTTVNPMDLMAPVVPWLPSVRENVAAIIRLDLFIMIWTVREAAALVGLIILLVCSVVMMVRWLWGFVRWRFREDFRGLNTNLKKKSMKFRDFYFNKNLETNIQKSVSKL